MNLFLWGKDVERAVHQVRAHAEKRENWYRLGISPCPPGDDAFFTVWSLTTKAVFSWTVVGLSSDPRHPPPGTVLRHLTVSVYGENRYPLPEVCFTLAHHFGFTGATPDSTGLYRVPAPTWMIAKDDDEQCIVIQEIVVGVTDATPPSAASSAPPIPLPVQ